MIELDNATVIIGAAELIRMSCDNIKKLATSYFDSSTIDQVNYNLRVIQDRTDSINELLNGKQN